MTASLPRARLRLAPGPGTTPRTLELLADSLLGQTERDWVLHADPDALGAEATRLLRRYGDGRLLPPLDAAPPGTPEATLTGAEVLAPTWLARLLAVLDRGAPAARCAATLFSSAGLSPIPAADAPACVLRRAEGAITSIPDRLVILRDGPAPLTQRRLPMTLFGEAYLPAGVEHERPPTLFVEVDTEAEFDWDANFSQDMTSVAAIGAVETAQALFDRHGLRPLYLIDFPVASQEPGIAAIGGIAGRGAAAVGAHLHPWTNPPFIAPAGRRHSYPGNLPAEAEAAKLAELTRVIETNFGERPVFYKAGRYGIGPNTARLIAQAGYQVDFSLLPETDLRHLGGPDFRRVAAIPYEIPAHGLLTMPMTRADIGPLSRWWNVRSWVDRQAALMLRVRGVLARTGLMERLTLTPEGLTAAEQIVLLKTLLARGHRSFVLHYHSPSLQAGNTKYVTTETDRLGFLKNLETVLTWFFDDLGGLPGRPWDLLPLDQRARKN